MNRRMIGLLFGFFLVSGAVTTASEPGWYGRPIVFGEQRAAIRATPILDRPYRPGHFYGNTVRRRYYRGTALPRAGDAVRGSAAVVRDAVRG